MPALTPFNLFPLITGRMPQAIADRLVQHLTDPTEFWTSYPVPSVALNDPKFNPLQMWRGPTWANINYLLIDGLFRSGYRHAGQGIAVNVHSSFWLVREISLSITTRRAARIHLRQRLSMAGRRRYLSIWQSRQPGRKAKAGEQ